MQFLGHRLRERRARVLPHFHFARVAGNVAVLADVQPRAHLLGERLPCAAARTAAGFLRIRIVHDQDHHQPAAQSRKEIAP